MPEPETFAVTGKVWQWRPQEGAASGWHFLTIEGPVAAEIRYAALGRSGGFGSIRVTATIGTTRWQTSLFPHKESGGFLLPLKAEVRRREGISGGSRISARIEV